MPHQFPSVPGWRHDLEDRQELASLQRFADVLPLLHITRSSTPVSKPWDFVHQENQGRQGSCQGNALTTVVETCYLHEAGKPCEQLSRQAGYIWTQEVDGLIGADRGSTINGGRKVATTRGLPEERLWPYTGQYHTRSPVASVSALNENAKQYRIAQHLSLDSYDDLFVFIDQGLGGAEIGIAWGSDCNAPVLESYSGGGGGHALALLFISPRTDRSGRNYIWMNNSWSESWGNRGWAEWSPTAINQMCRHRYTVLVGLSDMVEIEPRPLVIDHLGRLS